MASTTPIQDGQPRRRAHPISGAAAMVRMSARTMGATTPDAARSPPPTTTAAAMPSETSSARGSTGGDRAGAAAAAAPGRPARG